MSVKQTLTVVSASLSVMIAGLLIAPQSAIACATCGCSLSSDAATGFTTQAGWHISLQYDYINQDQLRHGTGTASAVPVGNEYESITTNRVYTAGVGYAPNARWNVNFLIPYVVRDHSTYGEYDPSATLDLSGSKVSSLGDIKIIGNYQGLLPTHNLGVQFGIKLPTGKHGDAVAFSTGPSAGDPLDTSLQPGTGSTDLILGAYYYQALSQNWDGFAHFTYEFSVQSRFEYRPGNTLNLSTGGRYITQTNWVPQIQLNVTNRDRDAGINADRSNSGGTYVDLSPGLSYIVTKRTQLYSFVQLPLYQNLDGYQLAPHWTATIGFSHKF